MRERERERERERVKERVRERERDKEMVGVGVGGWEGQMSVDVQIETFSRRANGAPIVRGTGGAVKVPGCTTTVGRPGGPKAHLTCQEVHVFEELFLLEQLALALAE